MKVGDRVEILRGDHAGKRGVIINTRGSDISSFVMVELERLVQGRPASGPAHPGYRVGVSLSNMKLSN